jgi:hypothetical protein
MIGTPDTPQGKRALELAIINAFFQPHITAAQIAVAFSTGAKKLHAADVQRIWDAAKESGDLPKINRPSGGPKERKSERARA